MKLLDITQKLKIRVKINLILGSFFLFVIFSLFMLYNQQVKKTFDDTHMFMSKSLGDIAEMMGMVEALTDSGFTKTDYDLLKPFFQQKHYYETGYPFLVTKSGDYLIHPWKEGTNEASSANHAKRLSYGDGSGYFKYIFSGDKRIKWQYVNYFKPYDAYVTVTFYEDELFRSLSKQKIVFLIFIGSALVIFFLGTVLTINPIVRAINRVKVIIGEVAKGKIVEPIRKHRRDEIGEMTQSIDLLIDEISKKTYFSNEIAKGNLDCSLQLQSDEDILGKSLINMRNSIVSAKEDEVARQLEVEKQNWTNEGLSNFAEMLRKNVVSIEDFTYGIVSSLVKYIGANQGGFYLVNSDNSNDIFIEMTACYAYERRKYQTKIIAMGEGLVGECIVEKESILLSDIPDSYMSITSGLGKGNPTQILIVPLKTDDGIIGAIELASFNTFEPHVIQFVERVSESTASTILRLKVNLQTEKLLMQTQSQTEQMKSQEEELRQNMEEMQSTQEEIEHREKELKAEIAHLKMENDRLANELKGAKL
ncbi:MAG: GAF domain-containing protein [Bacteroidales bacterium]